MLEHGGQLRAAAARYGIPLKDWMDLSTGINPIPFIPPPVPPEAWSRLPEEHDGLEEAAANYYRTQNILPVAGTQAAIQALPRLRRPCRVGVPRPGYAEHAHAWCSAGHEVKELCADEIAAQVGNLDVLVLMQPNNPTGKLFASENLLHWHTELSARGGWLIVDEAFIEASTAQSLIQAAMPRGLIVLRSMGKFFGLAGARAGFVAAHPALRAVLREALGPWCVAGPVRHVVRTALLDRAWQQATKKRLRQDGQRLTQLLRDADLPPTGGCGLFQWVQTERAEIIHQRLAQCGILTRYFAEPNSLRFGLPCCETDWLLLAAALDGIRDCRSGSARHACPDPSTMLRTKGLAEAVGQSPTFNGSPSMKSVTLMVQGATSDAGKSLLVTALCRWLVRQGVRVAPFKPQNMALNSAVTEDGGEIGRAQAVQAQAARLAPHTDMNPVLLKPNSDTGVQVIIHGHAVGNMHALEYHEYKSTAHAAVLQSHRRLSERYSVVVVEGAGSPAEINLRANDIANMGFAEAVDCRVILIADIDRGGVFAHLVGTLALLSASERERVAGFVINRFRGDLSLLQPGLDWLEQETGKPVLGVLPYLHDLHLEAEDAISLPSSASGITSGLAGVVSRPSRMASSSIRGAGGEGAQSKKLRVIVPRLPHISNHTDFDPLRLHPQIEFSFVALGEDIPAADLIILPGSKSVRSDLDSLRKAGWETAIQRHLRYGGKLIGICGGLQMLGQEIRDPLGIEGATGNSAGLGLLELNTTLQAEKQLRNVRGTLMLEEVPVSGYEIHAGVSAGRALQYPAVLLEHGADGAIGNDGQILATYLHGLFESSAATDALLRWAGLREAATPDYRARREADIDRLADAVEQHLDSKQLRSLFGLSGNAVDSTVRPELVEPPITNKEPFGKLGANGIFLKQTA